MKKLKHKVNKTVNLFYYVYGHIYVYVHTNRY